MTNEPRKTHARTLTALAALALLMLPVPATAQSSSGSTSDSMMDDGMMDDKDGAMMDSTDDSGGLSPWTLGIGAVVLAAIVAGIVLLVRRKGA